MASRKNPGVFVGTLLPEGEKRWTSFGAGLGLECLALALLIVVPLLMPQKFEIAPHYWVTPVDVPVVQPWKPQPRPKPVVVKREIVKEVLKPVVIVPKPKIYDPVITSPIAKVATRKTERAPEIAKALPDVSMGSSAIPTLKRPREPVQTGGFGDPNGVPDNGNRDRNPNIALLGSFDMPAGPGVGNGKGGKNGERGVVSSAGFGNGVAVGSSGGPRGNVQQGVFANEQAAAAPRVKHTAVSNAKPVEILSVPRPVYTAEGRAKKIQGVVLLQVVFTAAGEVKVERVVQGLGYGLDQAAEDAARKIRFRPATQDGQPVDFSAVARIEFELAY
jgi:TonB family protein